MRGTQAWLAVFLFLAPNFAAASQAFVRELEPNDSIATATPLGGVNVVVYGEEYGGDPDDYFSFTAQAGDRVYAAVMTSASAGGVDSYLTLRDVAANVLADDSDDGCLGSESSSIAGAVIPSTGTYYVEVYPVSGGGVRPYQLHFRLQRGLPWAESEPNDSAASADLLPASGWIAGSRGSSTDADWYELDLAAGDSVFLSLDSGSWDGRLAFGMFGDALDQLLVADGSAGGTPVSEALFATVKGAGTYYVRVDSSSSVTGSYTLSASVHTAQAATPTCTTYTSSDVPKTIPAGSGFVSSMLVVPGHPRIADLDVAVRLDHAAMPDLDAHLRSPAGNDDGLWSDIGASAQTQMDLVLDDEAAFPIGSFPPMKGLVVQPESPYRLSWFDGEDAGGTWRLALYDDTNNASGGTLLGWSITLCEPSPPACQTPLYRADFEAGDAGGFTHSGTADEWSLGTPSGGSAPILGCHSGSGCFKTDLTGKYEANSAQDLDSPPISLPAAGGLKILASWAQAYQMGDVQPLLNPPGDLFDVEVLEASSPMRRIFEWTGAAMTDTVGALNNQIAESAGWGLGSADLTAYAGKSVRLRFHVTSNGTLNYAGVGIDDVSIALCCVPGACDDANPCTADTCDPGSGCSHATIGGPCEDGNACLTGDVCSNGTCMGGSTPANCDDHDPCTVDGCDPASGCTHTPDSCNDNDPCTADSCDPALGCVHTQADLPCEDGNACTTGDHCVSGTCVSGAGQPSCDDGIACTVDSCNPSSGCVHTANNAACPQGECYNSVCSPSVGGCVTVTHDNQACNGGNLCQHGRCFGMACTILFTNDCGTPWNCGLSACNPATGQCVDHPDACDDHNPCTVDSCNGAGACLHDVGPTCDDGDPCNVDGCAADGSCTHGAPPCGDSNPCTADSYDCAQGACAHSPAAPPEVPMLRVSKSFLQWDPVEQDGTTRYQAVRGSLLALPVGSAPASQACLTSGTTNAGIQESAIPIQGAGFWYLVRAKHSCGVGSYGYQGQHGAPGAERVTGTCP